MSFTSLHDPANLARAYGALDAAWAEIRAGCKHETGSDAQLVRLSTIILHLLDRVPSDQELVTRAVQRFFADRLQ